MRARADESVETVTFRIPSSLKSALDASADTRGETATAVLRAALEQYLGGDRYRVYELPGFTTRFDSFLKERLKQRGKPPVALLVQGREGRGYVYEGTIDFNCTADGVVAVRSGDATNVIPRAFVVGWYGDDAATVNRIVVALTRMGWTVVRNNYL
jgi:hypothetical protein